MKLLLRFKNLMAKFRSRAINNNNNSLQLSSDLANKLIENRVEFKLYAAKQVLDRLKQLEKEGSISSSNIGRVKWEMNIECLLAHLVGSVDAILVRINDKLRLGQDVKYVNSSPTGLKAINDKLNAQGNGKLLEDLNTAIQPKSWLWTLKDVRNQGLHRSLINIRVKVGMHDDVNTGKSWSDGYEISLRTDPQTDLAIIPYLEDSINRTKKLIEDIIQNEPLLKI
jgi:hypothetical protein